MAPIDAVASRHTIASWEFVMTPATLSPFATPAARNAFEHLLAVAAHRNCP